MEVLEIIAKTLGYIGTIGAALAVVWRTIHDFATIQDGARCQLRSDMLHIYYRNKDTKQIRQYELENFLLMYKSYKAMKGNSFIEEIHNEVTSWEIIS